MPTQDHDPSDISDMELSRMTAYELLDAMDAAFPHRCIDPKETFEAAHRYAGAREMIDRLLMVRQMEIEEKAENA